MDKPKPYNVVRLDYHECAKYIEYKLGYGLRRRPGMDFWHWLISHCDYVTNGCELIIPYEHLNLDEDAWQLEILQAFWLEFGKETIYWVEW